HLRVVPPGGGSTTVQGDRVTGRDVERITRTGGHGVQLDLIGAPARIVGYVHVVKTHVDFDASIEVLRHQLHGNAVEVDAAEVSGNRLIRKIISHQVHHGGAAGVGAYAQLVVAAGGEGLAAVAEAVEVVVDHPGNVLHGIAPEIARAQRTIRIEVLRYEVAVGGAGEGVGQAADKGIGGA